MSGAADPSKARKVRILFKRITFYTRPFELTLDLEEGEDIDDAIDRHWCSGRIPGEAEATCEAQQVEDYEVLK